MVAVRFIDEQASLAAFLASIRDCPAIAIDTEFVRERTYYSRLCLLQFGTAESIACVDPLASLDLSGLWSLVLEPTRTKVIHAARQDLEIFFQTLEALPGPLFDTQIAAALLGHPAQLGYAALVEQRLGIQLDKSSARTDWSRRPLHQQQLTYAANDVRHLLALHSQLEAELQDRGRWPWADEDSQSLLAPALYRVQPEEAWRRVKGLRRLGAIGQEVARRLATWRELTAMQADRPRRWILADKAILDIARTLPGSVDALQRLELPPAFVRKHGQMTLKLLADIDTEQAQSGYLPPAARPTAEEKLTLERMNEVLRNTASELALSPELLATRQELVELMRGNRRSRVLSGWRCDVIASQLLKVLGE